MAVQETRTLPAQFVEDLGTDLAKQLVAQTGVPVVSTGIAGISQQPGEDAAQFAARQKAAEQFQIRQQSLSGLAPQVASQDPLQQQAQQLAHTRYWIVSTIFTSCSTSNGTTSLSSLHVTISTTSY
jgi:hypothetical protein